MEKHLEDALWILSELDPTHTVEQGFLRTFRILRPEYEGNIIDELVEKKLVVRCHYESNAYDYYYLSITDEGARKLLRIRDWTKRIVENMVNLLSERWFRNFLNWLDYDYWKVYEVWKEDEVKAEYKDRYGDDLELIIKELVRERILIIDYWPHRRRAGRRKSMPAHWELRLSRPASMIIRFWREVNGGGY